MPSQDLAEKLVKQAAAAELLLATAESCTGGGVANAITDISGSSAVLEAGIVTYANSAKEKLLAVPAQTLDAHGAVSQQTAEAMLAGLWLATSADVGVAITGIAGPTGGSPDKPVGTVWFAWGDRNGVAETACVVFDGNRQAVRSEAVEYALNRLLDTVNRL
jgi:nicotinamide-nucleotide amidase